MIDQLIKEWIDFNMEIKFHFAWIYWMTLHVNWIELNSNSTQFNSMIGLKLNSIEEKWYANWWKRFCRSTHEYGVGKKT
jgi:hypothetical protein